MYEHERSKVMKMLDENSSRVSVTADMWTNNEKKTFMAITVHYVDDSWSLMSPLIRFLYVVSPHTDDGLAEVLKDNLMDWNLDRKLSKMTVDNCSTNDSVVVGMFVHKLSIYKETMLLNGSWLHMRCFTHISNSILKDGLKYIGEFIEKIRDTIIYWTAGAERIDSFRMAL
ncbi:hypothetical protein M5689_014981 [Euphorbia peplus]|nr:hypothetical protein M5689_014981 [Euphorbia peplus]